MLSSVGSQTIVCLTLSMCPQKKREELQNLPGVPRGHLIIFPEELQVIVDVAGRTIILYMDQLLCDD